MCFKSFLLYACLQLIRCKDETASIEKEIEQSIIEMLQSSQTMSEEYAAFADLRDNRKKEQT